MTAMKRKKKEKKRNEATRTRSVFNVISNLNTFDCSALNWKSKLIVLVFTLLLFPFLFCCCALILWFLHAWASLIHLENTSGINRWRIRKNRNTHSCTDFKENLTTLLSHIMRALVWWRTVPLTHSYTNTSTCMLFGFCFFTINGKLIYTSTHINKHSMKVGWMKTVMVPIFRTIIHTSKWVNI